MNKAQAAFEILYLISAVDGTVDDDEIQVICTALTENYHHLSLDPLAILESLRGLSETERLERFHAATKAFAAESAAAECHQLLTTATELAAVDGESETREQSLLSALKTQWQL